MKPEIIAAAADLISFPLNAFPRLEAVTDWFFSRHPTHNDEVWTKEGMEINCSFLFKRKIFRQIVYISQGEWIRTRLS